MRKWLYNFTFVVFYLIYAPIIKFNILCCAEIALMLKSCLSCCFNFLYRLVIDKKERKLKKGSGFHLDIVLVCLSNVGCGLIGAPFMCAATVRSVAHVSALTVMSSNHAPGDKPYIIDVKGIIRVQFGSVDLYLMFHFLNYTDIC